MVSSYPRRRVLVVTPMDMGCFRDLIRGISSYGNNEGNWHMEFCSPDNDFLRAIKVGAPDGLLLGSVYPAESVRKAIGLVPAAIGVCGGHKRNRIKLAEIESDDVAVGVIGAQHLLGKGFRNFGFVGEKGGIEWSQLRERGFTGELAKSGHSAAVYEISWSVELQKIVPGKAEDGELN